MERRKICPPFFVCPECGFGPFGSRLRLTISGERRWKHESAIPVLQKLRQTDLKGPSFKASKGLRIAILLISQFGTWDLELGTFLRTQDSGLETSFFLELNNGKQKIPARKASGSPPEALARSNDSM